MFLDNNCETADLSLAPSGHRKIEWVKSSMPVLSSIHHRFTDEKPLAGLDISISIHLEAKTAYFAQVLAAGGANVRVTGCNPLSTQDDVAAALAEDGFSVHAIHGASPEEYHRHLTQTLENVPHVIVDDGGDLVQILHEERPELGARLIGGCEETTTGVHRLRARAEAGQLRFPMIAVNDAGSKHLFDNRYGTGQSVWDAIMHTTNRMITGKTVVVAGYGFCGRGIAKNARGLGANVIVTEVAPHAALEAVMDGNRVMTMREAAPLGDIFVTATGCRDVITQEHFARMKHDVLLCNAGHFDVEVSVRELRKMAVAVTERRDNITGYLMADGRILNVLGEGRLVNLAAGNGHPAEIMDMSFGLQALCVEYTVKHRDTLPAGQVIDVPFELDEQVAKLKLAALGASIDTLTDAQVSYLHGWHVE